MRYNTPCFEAFCDNYGFSKRYPSPYCQFTVEDYDEVVWLAEDVKDLAKHWSDAWNAGAKYYNSFGG